MRNGSEREEVTLEVGSSRRRVLATLTAAGVGLWGVPAIGSKKTRKAVKRAKKRGKQKCRKQDGQCTQAFTEICTARNSDPADAATCTLQFTACCPFLSDCQTTAFFDCIFAQG